jgi:hypothetical protein
MANCTRYLRLDGPNGCQGFHRHVLGERLRSVQSRNAIMGALLAADDFAPHYRVPSLAEILVSSRPGPSTVALPVVFTCTRPNVSTNTQNASGRNIQRRNAAITG